jgi:hydroxymethylpyrimidine pyrophosphatase-like HAD family hydrolase
MAFKPKLLVLDIDGTIVNRSGNISQTDLLSLQEARQSGLKIALCTGSVVTAAANVFKKIALPG